jgi:hypothetical protein
MSWIIESTYLVWDVWLSNRKKIILNYLILFQQVLQNKLFKK